MKLSLCLMFKHLAGDKWLGQKKLPAMIVWKKNLKKSPSCIRSLENWLLISTYSHLAHQTRSCWIKRENLHKNEMTVVILKLNDERRKKKEILVMYFYCDLVADKKWRIIRKKINIFLPLTSSAEQQLVWPPNHWRESNICSKLKFLDQNLNRHHSPPP